MAILEKKDILGLFSTLCCIFIFSFLFNFLWEALHAVYLYRSHDVASSVYVPMLLYVSLMDGLIISGVYLGIGLIWWNLLWVKNVTIVRILSFAFGGMGVAAIIEHLAIFHDQRWDYKEEMPTVLGIGVSPLVQLSITGLLAVWLTRELLYGEGLFREARR
jgi:hypothetical protein